MPPMPGPENPTRPPPPDADAAGTPRITSAFKSRPGLARLGNAARYSLAGLKAAYRHEAAFRQELAVAVPALLLAPFLAPGRWQLLVMVLAVLAVLVVELLNSAVEALADAISVEHHPLLGRAKDLGSAAVSISLVMAVLAWAIALWP